MPLPVGMGEMRPTGGGRATTTIDGRRERTLAADLSAAVRGDVLVDSGTRAVYSTDASNYRHVPLCVVLPRTTDDVVAAMEVCRAHDAPVLLRGAGTSIAGQASNEAVVLDTTRHLDRVIGIDPDRRLARVQPGVVLDDLRAQATRYGLTYGPDPSTHDRCTIGGMIGNNACGTHSLVWGKTVDTVESLDVLLYDGTRLELGPLSAAELRARIASGGRIGELHAGLRSLRDRYLADIRSGFPPLPRRVSGYNLDRLLPENGFDLARALVGSEGTCAATLAATVRLVELPPARALLVVGFLDMAAAGDAVPLILPHRPLGLEGIGHGIVDCLTAQRPGHRGVRLLPDGGGWLFVEVAGETTADAVEHARALDADLGGQSGVFGRRLVDDPALAETLWAIREQGAGLASRLPDGREAWSGWEDAAVPPHRLGDYLRDFDRLLARHDLRGVPYGHFGDGCIHVRIDFDLRTSPGVAGYRRFLEDAADLVVHYGGSLSGEHGDGQARGELLRHMFSPELLRAFGEFRGLLDPAGRMNPGNLVEPRPLDRDLRLGADYRPRPLPVALALRQDGGSLAAATRRCVGVGTCRRPTSGVMCPSWMVTREEKHSTRGRSRLLFEMLRGDVVTGGWRSPEVREALDLCLACKGCRSDCPVGVDMATYKAEFLHQHYAGRLRPASHYAMGFLPLWAALGSSARGLARAALRRPAIAAVAKRLAGVAPEREIPALASYSFTRWFRASRVSATTTAGRRGPVLLWPDTFSNHFDPGVAQAATEVLEAAGFSVETVGSPVCCGLTWFSTGQIAVARWVVRRTLRLLRPALEASTPIAVLEPSCAAMFRSDLAELLPGDEDARRLARQTLTLAEALTGLAPDWRPPGADRTAVTQVHCHQHAVLGHEADERLMARAGLRNETLDSGCCGLAGNFGFERGHYEVSMACAERVLLPAVRVATPGTILHADGFSCRIQVAHATGRRPLHLAEILRAGV